MYVFKHLISADSQGNYLSNSINKKAELLGYIYVVVGHASEMFKNFIKNLSEKSPFLAALVYSHLSCIHVVTCGAGHTVSSHV